MTTGEKNNPLNVKQGQSAWNGSTGKDARGHAIFASVPWGVRAAIRTLAQYQLVHKRWSLDTIMARWAPSSDTIGSIAGNKPNQPKTYAGFVADRIGIDKNSSIRLFRDNGDVLNECVLYAVVSAMAIYENGHGYKLDFEDFQEGVALYRDTWVKE